MRLSDWQAAFEDYLLAESPSANPALLHSLVGGPSLDIATGLAIYHNAYHARLEEVLRGDFPTLHNWLGDDEFARLAEAYIRRQPSTHYSLRWLGQGLEAFIGSYLEPCQSAPLGELAALEWDFTLAFDAPPGAALSLADMAGLQPEEWATLQVDLQPYVQWRECRFNSVALWRAFKDGAAFPGSVALEEPQVCLVWRDARICRYRSLPAAEARALAGMARQGWNFAELCAELAVTYKEDTALQAVSWLKQWVHDGLLQRRY
ncbi:DNA-binding domain-containing protein [Pseudomonas chlororaphis]|uniref:DUF2063 domain-containing protein n=1 Tax=Pseudomonas chlororaphis TaxID=587753 RepID=A0A1Q8EHJ3_9PSED|nr:DNA-binding domain-containing protein [Pseudomonas chlororaphis]OLF51260.1 DUF2063 domain-containing protein [Pseudomonas chlororaphis]